MTDDLLIFTEESDAELSVLEEAQHRAPWKILIVDDEQEVHAVTKMALNDVVYLGRSLKFLTARNKAEALDLLAQHPDIAVGLIDVVMEEEHTGLEIVRYIREQRADPFMRIILRTGQPGQAPERQVVQEYDINDYKEKTELTTQKLFSTVYTALGNYSALIGLEENRHGLEKIIDASADLLEKKSLRQFIQGVLEQITALLRLDKESVFVQKLGVSTYLNHEQQLILAATGDDCQYIGKDPRKVLPAEVNAEIQQVLNNQETKLSTHRFIGYFRSSIESEAVIYISSSEELSLPDRNLLKIFLRNVSIGIEHLHLREEIELTQNEIVYMLGDAVESRSRETANHVRRVAENAKELALLLGLDPLTAQIIHSAAPLHDVGKIGIPDSILDKPAALTDGEWSLMQTHAQRGADLLSQSNRPILKAAAIIAVQHHENWDGSGYPNSLIGEDIHIYGRIVAIADVYDALCSERCYKDAWGIEKVLDYMNLQKGKKFDPQLIDLLIDNHERFVEIRRRFPDL